MQLSEEFVKIGLERETLNNNEDEGALHIATPTLLTNHEDFVNKLNEDIQQSTETSSPVYSLSSISMVLKSITDLIIVMKKAPPSKGLLTQISSSIKPSIANLMSIKSVEVLFNLCKALDEYIDLFLLDQSTNCINTSNGLTRQ